VVILCFTLTQNPLTVLLSCKHKKPVLQMNLKKWSYCISLNCTDLSCYTYTANWRELSHIMLQVLYMRKQQVYILTL